MTTYDLLIIDPQNDFLDIAGAALPVPGAAADMQRLADWLVPHAARVRSITVTLDSHASVGVERTTFWLQSNGEPVAPFTVITAADLARGQFKPRNPALQAEVQAYLHALEATGQRQLVVWPVHCVLGTWGHNIHAGLSEALAAWELATGQMVHKVLKGQNPTSGASDLSMDPTNPRILYAAMWNHGRKPWFVHSGGTDGGIFSFGDAGFFGSTGAMRA